MIPHIARCEDGSVLIEWIRPSERLGVSLEPDLAQSSWFYVNREGVMEAGLLEPVAYAVLQAYFAEQAQP